MRLSQMDVYVNIAGGVRLREPAVDLGIIIAVISSFKDIVIDDKTLVFGEVGLSGEIRSVSQAPLRVREAVKLGFEKVILPKACMKAAGDIKGVQLIGVSNVRELLSILNGSIYKTDRHTEWISLPGQQTPARRKRFPAVFRYAGFQKTYPYS